VTLWLFGDSIFNEGIGAASLTPEDALWPVRSPGPMLDLMAGEAFVRRGGGTLIPDGVDRASGAISKMVGRDIAAADVVAMLDVGPHGGDPDLHERQWLTLRGAAARHPGLVLICEGFDNGARGEPSYRHCRRIGERSPNAAVQAAALAPIEEAGRTSFVRIAKPLLRYHHALAEEHAPGAFHPDGVHLNAWGQGRLCWLLLEALGRAGAAARKRWGDFAGAVWRELEAPSAAAAVRFAELACEPSRAGYA
jgi:hypothetical protein